MKKNIFMMLLAFIFFTLTISVAEGYILKVIDLSPQARTSLGLLLHTQASLQDQQVSGSI